MQAYETNNSIHRQNHAIKADDDSRSRKRTALYINHTNLTDEKNIEGFGAKPVHRLLLESQ